MHGLIYISVCRLQNRQSRIAVEAHIYLNTPPYLMQPDRVRCKRTLNYMYFLQYSVPFEGRCANQALASLTTLPSQQGQY